jgi:bacillithiol biosynthesis deacetylase BshB1
VKTRYGVSPWVQLAPVSRRRDFPAAKGELSADVVIVGGGLTGCAIAQASASAGLRTILLEAGRIGQGSAGRSAGLLLPEPGPLFRDVVQAHGLRPARHVFESWRRASLDAASLLKRLKIRCGLEPLATLLVGDEADVKLLRREHAARADAGLPVTWLTERPLGAATNLSASGAIKMRDAFALDPYLACLGLASAARARKAALFERSPATKVTFNQKGVEVLTARARIRASQVVVTTGTATRTFAPLVRHFKPRDSYLVLTEPLPLAVRRQVGAAGLTFRDMRVPRRRVRWTPDHRLLIAGADQASPAPRARDAVLVQRTGQLMYELLTMYPAISGLRPEYGWDLPYGETADGLMYIGPHRNYPNHLFALGHSGDSIAGAFPRRVLSPNPSSERLRSRTGSLPSPVEPSPRMDTVDLLVFGPHPDDIEIGIGGTVARHAALGHVVGLCDLTAGEMGSNGSVEERLAEGEAARVVLGAAWRRNLRWPDRGIGTDPAHVRSAAELIREARPRAVALPYWSDRHPDHVAASQVLTEAIFNSGLRRYAAAGDPWRPEWSCYYFINDSAPPSFVVDVSEHYETKRRALACYGSQFRPSGAGAVATRLTASTFGQLIESRDAQYGALAGVAFAEGIVVREPVVRPHLLKSLEQS